MVGATMIAVFLLRRFSRAHRRVGTLRAIGGLRDIRTPDGSRWGAAADRRTKANLNKTVWTRCALGRQEVSSRGHLQPRDIVG
jgi:hypothetical protein